VGQRDGGTLFGSEAMEKRIGHGGGL